MDLNKENENELVHRHLLKHWQSLQFKPNIIVFDLDYTLWPYFIDSHVSPPISMSNASEIIDKHGYSFKPFKHVTQILKTLRENCLGEEGHLAIASRSSTKDLAMEAIQMYGWTSYLSSFQIYPRSKDTHMKQIQKELKFADFNQVLFFDDDQKNVRPTKDLGVLPFLVNQVDGLNLHAICDGLSQFNRKMIKN